MIEIITKYFKRRQNILRSIVSRLTMKRFADAFIDKVNGRLVKYYYDKYDVVFMAQSKYGFRVKTNMMRSDFKI